ncbi:uncharacterized protein [Hetaerina americana]|uniref:uncharacterized protein isoform X2 n=1 Tax=Hetaerina americana TaxID=62018 RepID=UPI003A7F28C7
MAISGEGRSVDDTWTNRESMETIVTSEVSAKEEIESVVSEETEMDPDCGFEETGTEVPVKLEKSYIDLSVTQSDHPGRYSSYFREKAAGFAVQGSELEDSTKEFDGDMCQPSKKSSLVTAVEGLVGDEEQSPAQQERASYPPAPLAVLANWCKLAPMTRTVALSTSGVSCPRANEESPVLGGSSNSCTSSDIHIIGMPSSLYPNKDKAMTANNEGSFAAFSTGRTQPTEEDTEEDNDDRVSAFGETEKESFKEMATGNFAVHSPVPCAIHAARTGDTQKELAPQP